MAVSMDQLWVVRVGVSQYTGAVPAPSGAAPAGCLLAR